MMKNAHKRIYILGICGTFMAGVAVLAKQLGFSVMGSDEKVYPPMSDQLVAQGIELREGYSAESLENFPDEIVVGNVIKRGNPALEFILNEKLNFISGPQWLAEHILRHKRVIAVSGTHGKTTTSSMIAFILEYAGLNPGFLIGGIPENFGVSARVTESPYFVIEADEYDSAFCDKRSKFIHYRPEILLINNIEFDHADIFSDLAAIQTQFHFLIRTVPSNGLIVIPGGDEVVEQVIEKGCWTPLTTVGLVHGDWQAREISSDGSSFRVYHLDQFFIEINWSLLGLHNVKNALASIAAAHHLGISPEKIREALVSFRNVKRRMEVKGVVNGVTVYDDFAHHPTAIETTLSGLRAKVGAQRIIALLELGSYTMRTGVHKEALVDALKQADEVYFLRPQIPWDIDSVAAALPQPHAVFNHVEEMVSHIAPRLKAKDHVLVMSNHAFGGVHEKLLTAIA